MDVRVNVCVEVQLRVVWRDVASTRKGGVLLSALSKQCLTSPSQANKKKIQACSSHRGVIPESDDMMHHRRYLASWSLVVSTEQSGMCKHAMFASDLEGGCMGREERRARPVRVYDMRTDRELEQASGAMNLRNGDKRTTSVVA